MAPALQVVNTTADFDAAVKANSKAVAFFWASWSSPCQHMAQVLEALAKQYGDITFLKIEAEEVDDVTERFNITTVPHFILLQAGKVVDQLEGADAAALTAKVTKLAAAAAAAAAAATPSAAPVQADVISRIKSLVNDNQVVLFMKGSAAQPYCGFSRKVVDALRDAGASRFVDVDIFKDEELRQKLKEYSNWPTYPQLYVGGELVGGCDIVMEMAQTGELKQLLQEKAPEALKAASQQQQQRQQVPAAAAAPKQSVPAAVAPKELTAEQKEHLRKLTQQQPVMLFMKGTLEAPRCGFSRKVADALSSDGISFGTFDILSDAGVRQGLKLYSQWPTYPQVYVQGELLGGCDIVLEMKEGGELKANVEEMLHRMQKAD